MKFFLFIAALTVFLHSLVPLLGLEGVTLKAKSTPHFMRGYQEKIKNSFKKPENANMLFSFITGNKSGISPYTKKAFKRTNLSFLLSPSGIHLSAFLMILFYPLKKSKNKILKRFAKLLILPSAFFLPEFNSLQRSAILRLLFQFKFITRFQLSLEHIFLMTFALAFCLGHFHRSPLSFIYSFAYLGVFFSLRDYPKIMLIAGFFSIQLLLGLFSGEKSSILAVPVGLFGSFIFSLLFPVLLLFLASFWIVDINWAEPLIRGFIVTVQFVSKNLQGSFTSSSIFLILGIWVFMWMENSNKKYTALVLLLTLHTNSAMSPVLWRQ